jgi:CRISPR-associated endonuclease/helicase Cas3
LTDSWQVLRRKDLYQLFDTDPDLTGFDVDVSPYVRGADDPDVRVFWREVADVKAGPRGEEARRPHRDEICAVPIGQAKTWLAKNNKRRAFVWDWVDKRWTRWTSSGPERSCSSMRRLAAMTVLEASIRT